MIIEEKNYKELKKFCSEQGADLFGVADISQMQTPHSSLDFTRDSSRNPERSEGRAGNFREKSEKNSPYGSMGMNKLSEAAIKDLDKAICIGVRLSKQILDDIQDQPTQLYFHHYKTANFFLDQLTFKLSNFIQRKGALALPIAASQIVDWQRQSAHASHKKLGYLAGLGWIGRNNLLVSPKFGAQFRLATVFTNLKIKLDKPLDKDCDDCYDCISVCPVNAIKKNKEDFSYMLCFEKLKEFQKANIVGQYICGICVKTCNRESKED